MLTWKNSLTLTIILTLSLAFSPLAFCEDSSSWPAFVAQLRAEAIADGIRTEVFDQAFANIQAPNARILRFDKTQPEKRLSFLAYRDTRVDPYRIQLGREALLQHQSTLNQISYQYGVNACFIVSIWGLETSYGHYKGKFPVIASLATLTYNPRRSDFFHHELKIALHMLNDNQVSLSDFKGEWAGASGHCQFMPSTWLKYGVSYRGTGKVDIWNNVDDALASIANFLEKNGWHPNEPWAIQVTIPADINQNIINIKTTKTVNEWVQLGIQPVDRPLPTRNLPASVIYPDGGPGLMVFDNFKTLLKWNKSNYYVGALGYLAEEICQEPL